MHELLGNYFVPVIAAAAFVSAIATTHLLRWMTRTRAPGLTVSTRENGEPANHLRATTVEFRHPPSGPACSMITPVRRAMTTWAGEPFAFLH